MPERTETDRRRQFVTFNFYQVDPAWRRLSPPQKEEHRHAYAEIIRRWQDSGQMNLLTYSLTGLRSDADMMLWRICFSLECLQQSESDLLHTPLGGYLTSTRTFLAMTRRSQYRIGSGYDSAEHATMRCGAHKYAFIYPFVKTRNWYHLPFEERQRIVSEYIRTSEEFPRVHVNTLYSFGLADSDFLLAVETDNPADMVDRVVRLRETENSGFVASDTPVYTCVQCGVDEMLARLG